MEAKIIGNRIKELMYIERINLKKLAKSLNISLIEL